MAASCMDAAKDMLGFRVNRLTVVSRAAKRGKSKAAFWLCQCVCGGRGVFSGADLRRGRSFSCGCLQRETAAALCESRTKHGAARRGKRSGAYRSYIAAKYRCENPHDSKYAYYGGLGVRFLFGSFEEFAAELGERPPGMTVDRIDPSGDYAPGNVRWASRLEQSRNTRRRKCY